MRFKKINIINLSILLIVAILLIVFTYKTPKYVAGFLVGGLVGFINFLLICYSLNRPMVIKSRRFVICKVIRYLLIISALVLSCIYPKVMNVFCVLIGYLINKISIILVEGIKWKGSAFNVSK